MLGFRMVVPDVASKNKSMRALDDVMIFMQIFTVYIKILEYPLEVLLSTPYDPNLQLLKRWSVL